MESERSTKIGYESGRSYRTESGCYKVCNTNHLKILQSKLSSFWAIHFHDDPKLSSFDFHRRILGRHSFTVREALVM